MLPFVKIALYYLLGPTNLNNNRVALITEDLILLPSAKIHGMLDNMGHGLLVIPFENIARIKEPFTMVPFFMTGPPYLEFIMRHKADIYHVRNLNMTRVAKMIDDKNYDVVINFLRMPKISQLKTKQLWAPKEPTYIQHDSDKHVYEILNFYSKTPWENINKISTFTNYKYDLNLIRHV